MSCTLVDVDRLKNLGPKSRSWLAGIGITSTDELRARDPFDVYAELKAKIPGVSLNMLYALIGAVEDQDWQVIQRERKSEILFRLDDMGLAPRR